MGRKSKLRQQRKHQSPQAAKRDSMFLGMTVRDLVRFVTQPRDQPLLIMVMPDVYDHVLGLLEKSPNLRGCVYTNIRFQDVASDRYILIAQNYDLGVCS